MCGQAAIPPVGEPRYQARPKQMGGMFNLTQNERAAVNEKALGGNHDRYEGKATFMG